MVVCVALVSPGGESAPARRAITGAADRLGLGLFFLSDPGVPAERLVHLTGVLHSAHVVVADLSASDPFTVSALSVAQCLGKKVILTAAQIERVPFDLRSYRVEVLSAHDEHNFARLSSALKEALASESIVGPLGGTIVYGQNLFARRLLAFLLDILPFGAAAGLAWRRISGDALIFTLEGIGLAFYLYSSLLTSLAGRTPGQRLLDLKVVTTDGRKLTRGRSFARELVGGLVCLATYGTGFLWALKRPAFRALHDSATDSLVVRGPVRPTPPRPKARCLVIMPFQEEVKWHLDLFRAAGEGLGVAVSRVDDYSGSGNILHAIADGLSGADLIVSDLTGDNLNVVYELSIAQCLSKRIVYVREGSGALDLSPHGVVPIESDTDEQVRRIQSAMSAALAGTHVRGPFGEAVVYGERLCARRAGAFLLDLLPLIVVLIPVAILMTLLGEGESEARQAILLLAPLGGTFVLYDGLFTTIKGWTPGQRLLGLRVVTVGGGPVPFVQAMWRAALEMAFSVTWGATFLWCLKGPAHSALHDVVSRTMVVRRRS